MQTSASSSQLPVVAETRLHKRYLALWSRTVRFPDGRDVDWDVVGHMQPNPVFVVVFPFSTARGTTTLVREYAQGPNEFMYTLAAGQYERQAHSSVLDAARCELAEEARLSGGHWEPLLPDGHTGVSELKWSTNKFSPWLCIDPQKDTAQLAERDADELFMEEREVTVAELRELVLAGRVMLPSVQTALMALHRLRALGLLAGDAAAATVL